MYLTLSLSQRIHYLSHSLNCICLQHNNGSNTSGLRGFRVRVPVWVGQLRWVTQRTRSVTAARQRSSSGGGGCSTPPAVTRLLSSSRAHCARGAPRFSARWPAHEGMRILFEGCNCYEYLWFQVRFHRLGGVCSSFGPVVKA